MNISINETQYRKLKKKLLKSNLKEAEEPKWYNTVLDVVGLFDPTGVADVTNAVIYATQGNYTFAILSAISVIPYIGDAIAKPLLFLGRSSKIIKASDRAILLLRQGDRLGAERILSVLTKKSSLFDKLAKWIGTNSIKMQKWLQTNANNKIIKTLGVKLVSDWLGILGRIGSGSRQATSTVGRITNRVRRGNVATRMTNKDAIDLLTQLSKVAKENKFFTGGKQMGFWEAFKKYPISGGLWGKFYGNRQVRSLMNRTKWYLGFLDYLGYGNFVGADELEKELGSQEFNNQLEAYSNTPEAKENWESEFGNVQQNQSSIPPSTPPQTQNNNQSKGVLRTLFPDLF
jgi:hypothetical protein